MSIRQNVACRRLSSLGIKQAVVHQILNTVQNWIRNEGLENTISRLKQLKTAYVQKLAGAPVDLSWISHKGDTPKGPFSHIFNMRNPQKALSALMVYSQYTSTELTPKQVHKFFSSLEAEPRDWRSYLQVRTTDKLELSDEESSIPWSNIYDFRITGNVPGPDGIGTLKDPDHGCVRSIRKDPYYEGIIMGNRAEFTKNGFHHPGESVTLSYKYFSEPMRPGRIGFIQEPGFKLRAVANPHRGLQYLLEPLKKTLLSVLKNCPNDCTHDQSKGWEWGQKFLTRMAAEKLSHGTNGQLSSVDLSDATNLFPLGIQLDILRNTFKGNTRYMDMIDVFERASRLPWKVSGLDEKDEVTWRTGQPLGLAPSFPAFALAHHFIMYRVIEGEEPEGSFQEFLRRPRTYKILGDDIIMSSALEPRYRKIMGNIGCSISENKSLRSATHGEFASRVFTKDTCLIQGKWKTPSDHNFMDLVSNLGPSYVKLLPTRQRKVVETMSQLPESKGGLGWNPNGIPLTIREHAADLVVSKSEWENIHRKDIQASFAAYKDSRDISQDLINKNEEWIDRIREDEVNPNTPNRSVQGFLDDTHKFISKSHEKSEQVPKDYSLVDLTSDPRGTTQLESFEKRIAQTGTLCDLPTVKGEEGLEYLASFERNTHEVATVLSDISSFAECAKEIKEFNIPSSSPDTRTERLRKISEEIKVKLNASLDTLDL